MNLDLQEYIDETKNFNLNEQTEKLLHKYAWEMRYQEDNTLLPLEEYEKVHNIILERFKDDFIWKGNFPSLSYSNLLGVRNQLLNTDDDSMIGIIAPPGRGKSTFTLSCARLLDSTFTHERTIFTMNELKSFLRKATNIFNQIKAANKNGEQYPNPLAGKVVVLDEGVYLLFSGDAQSKNGKTAQKLFSVIRALNLIFLVNITNWRKISGGVKEDRFKCLFRIPSKGFVQFYSQKKISQIETNKTSVDFPKPNFYDRTGYIEKSCKFWKGYEEKKSRFLDEITHEVDQ